MGEVSNAEGAFFQGQQLEAFSDRRTKPLHVGPVTTCVGDTYTAPFREECLWWTGTYARLLDRLTSPVPGGNCSLGAEGAFRVCVNPPSEKGTIAGGVLNPVAPCGRAFRRHGPHLCILRWTGASKRRLILSFIDAQNRIPAHEWLGSVC